MVSVDALTHAYLQHIPLLRAQDEPKTKSQRNHDGSSTLVGLREDLVNKVIELRKSELDKIKQQRFYRSSDVTSLFFIISRLQKPTKPQTEQDGMSSSGEQSELDGNVTHKDKFK